MELVGENDLEPLNMIHHDSFNTGKSMTAGGPSSGGHAQSEGAASTPTVQLHDPTHAHLTDRHLSPQAAGVSPSPSSPDG